MSTKPHQEADDMNKRVHEALYSVIAEQVLHTLDTPDHRHRVQVRSLWGNFYRVNLLVGDDAACMKVASSYFLKTDSDGRILESSPAMIKHTKS
jgi:hypothetical protein